MTIGSDIETMFDRAIADVFHGGFSTRGVVSDDPSWIRGVEVISRTREDRIVIIRVGRAWISGFIPQLSIGAALVDEDDDIAYKEAEVRKLCRALHSYLEGAGRVTQRRRLFGRGSTSELAIEVDGFEWCFGHRSWVWAHPV